MKGTEKTFDFKFLERSNEETRVFNAPNES